MKLTQMKIHVVDGTYELFRSHFGAPPNYQDALLFRELSTLHADVPLKENLNDLKWSGAYPPLKKVRHELVMKESQSELPSGAKFIQDR